MSQCTSGHSLRARMVVEQFDKDTIDAAPLSAKSLRSIKR